MKFRSKIRIIFKCFGINIKYMRCLDRFKLCNLKIILSFEIRVMFERFGMRMKIVESFELVLNLK